MQGGIGDDQLYAGFSSTLFQNRQTGKQVYALRGTQGLLTDLVLTDLGDIVMDGLAIHQVVDMYNDWQLKLRTQLCTK